MTFVLFGLSFWHVVFGVGMFSIALFLILLILVQRGRGGGLTGALGGMGGQSAFGTKAGDTFTKVTMITAGIWILLCMASIKMLNKSLLATDSAGPPTLTAPNVISDENTDGDDSDSTDSTETDSNDSGSADSDATGTDSIGGIGGTGTDDSSNDGGNTPATDE